MFFTAALLRFRAPDHEHQNLRKRNFNQRHGKNSA
jgi:hypothetical protein